MLVLATSASAAAAESTNLTALTHPLPDVGTSLLRVGGAMVVVLAVFFGGIWCFRNWQRLTAGRGVAAKLQVIEVRALANRQALYLVACEGRKLLLGSSSNGLTTLCSLSSGEVGPLRPAPSTDESGCFANTLQANLSDLSDLGRPVPVFSRQP
jgi:flagellar biogenesis protein FliO